MKKKQVVLARLTPYAAGMRKIYVEIVADLLHNSHVQFLRCAREVDNHLIVTAAMRKPSRLNFLMNMAYPPFNHWRG